MSGIVTVGALTDEELAVLTRSSTLPVSPVRSRLTAAERQAAGAAARRSLVARGLVDHAVEGRVGLRRDLRSVLTLREAAGGVVAVARATARARDHWYAYVVDDVVLVELVDDDGIHRFALAAAGQLEGLVAGAALHPQAAPATTPSPGLAGDWLRSDVVVCRVAAEAIQWSVVSGPSGTWRLRGRRHGEHASAWSPDDVRGCLAGRLAGLRREAPRVSGSASR